MNDRRTFVLDSEGSEKEVELGELLTQLDEVGGIVEDSAERIKRLVERADGFIQNLGPKLGVEATADVQGIWEQCEYHIRLVIRRWDKAPASDNADGKWHIVFEVWGPGIVKSNTFDFPSYDYGDAPSYCQSLPSAKLDYRVMALPVLPTLLADYFAKAKEHLNHLIAVQKQLDNLESQIQTHEAYRGL